MVGWEDGWIHVELLLLGFEHQVLNAYTSSRKTQPTYLSLFSLLFSPHFPSFFLRIISILVLGYLDSLRWPSYSRRWSKCRAIDQVL